MKTMVVFVSSRYVVAFRCSDRYVVSFRFVLRFVVFSFCSDATVRFGVTFRFVLGSPMLRSKDRLVSYVVLCSVVAVHFGLRFFALHGYVSFIFSFRFLVGLVSFQCGAKHAVASSFGSCGPLCCLHLCLFACLSCPAFREQRVGRWMGKRASGGVVLLRNYSIGPSTVPVK